MDHGEKAAPTEFWFHLLTVFSNLFRSAFLFQVTCITDEGSAMTPVIKYSAGDGVGKYVKKLPSTYSFYVFVVEIWYVVHARQDGISLQDQGIP